MPMPLPMQYWNISFFPFHSIETELNGQMRKNKKTVERESFSSVWKDKICEFQNLKH